VNLEIVPYPSTDVLALNEQLPFRDETFDAVISCAVLEHVKDPFAAARELVRVTKRGGMIYADVPFLQPYHGYPSHYYNMTSQGLVNLFQDTCEISRTAVPVYGLPIWTLTWFLNSYLDGLPPAARERFRNLRVADLLARPESYLPQDFVQQLSEARNFELASVTSVLAIRK
jgi:SAM-dependent methyltransferase